MRLLALAVACAAVLCLPVLAQPYETPEDLLDAFYAPYLSDDIPQDQEEFRSEFLNGLYEADAENTRDGEMGALDFDPYIDGQDFDIADFEIGEASIRGDKARVAVDFTNFGQPRHIVYELVYEDGGWRIDDLVNENAEYSYRLSEIFEEAKQYW